MKDPLLDKLTRKLDKLVKYKIITVIERNIELTDYHWQKKTFKERMKVNVH